MSKRYQKKSASRKKRSKSGHGPSRRTVGGQTTGVMGDMVHGFRRAVGSEESKGQSKGSNLVWTAVFVTAVLAVIAWNFAQ